MKKKILFVIGIIFVVFLLASCGMQCKTHDFEEWSVVTEPTCLFEGLKVRECKKCDYTEEQTVAELGHLVDDWTTETAAGCETEGLETTICFRCDTKFSRTIEATGHKIGEWTVSKEADCETDGQKIRTCENCSLTETETIESVGHVYGEWVSVVEPTCETDGLNKRECIVCGSKEEERVSELGHLYEIWDVVEEASCTESGRKTSVCRRSSEHTTEEEIPAKGHKYKITVKAVEASCEKDGVSEGKECVSCGYVYSVSETIPALGHKDDNRDIDCDRCGKDVPFLHAKFVYTIEDLNNVRNDLDAVYVQMADIDLKGAHFDPIGSEEAPFTGRYYGNDFIIKNINYNAVSSESNESCYSGLFAVADGAMFDSIRVVAPYTVYSEVITATSNLEIRSMYCGGIVGYTSGDSIIVNCAVEDAYFEIVQKGEGINKNKIGFRNYIGGLCGYSKDSINVNNCYVNHCVVSSNLDNYNGNYGYQIETHVIGGLVGCTDDKAKVAYCYANVAIDTNVDDTEFSIPAARFGGLVGMANVEKVSVENCIAQFLPLDNLNEGEMSLSNLFNYLGDIEDISTAISNLYYIATEIEFDKQDVDLASNAITKGDLSNIFLRDVGFNGSIWSVVDGEICFNTIRNYK